MKHLLVVLTIFIITPVCARVATQQQAQDTLAELKDTVAQLQKQQSSQKAEASKMTRELKALKAGTTDIIETERKEAENRDKIRARLMQAQDAIDQRIKKIKAETPAKGNA